MAEFSFGPTITDNAFIKQHLPAIVDQLAQQCQNTGPFTIKAVHSLLLPFGVNIKGMRKHEELRLFVEAAFLRLALRHGVLEDALCPEDMETFLQMYPTFCGLADAEQERLMVFRNYMALAVRYIEPHQNRDYLLDLITRLAEGCGVRHVPGSGATLATRNRIDIYRKEGCVRKKPRAPRRTDPPRKHPLTEEAPPEYTAPLKRGRSLDEGGALKKQASGDGVRVWTTMVKEKPIVELFDLLDTMDVDPLSWGGSGAALCDLDLTPDELDAMLVNGHYPDPPGFLAGYKGAA